MELYLEGVHFWKRADALLQYIDNVVYIDRVRCLQARLGPSAQQLHGGSRMEAGRLAEARDIPRVRKSAGRGQCILNPGIIIRGGSMYKHQRWI